MDKIVIEKKLWKLWKVLRRYSNKNGYEKWFELFRPREFEL